MKTFAGRVAVITGAASGLGRALAGAFGAEGMKLVLADVDEAALARTCAEFRGQGLAVLAQPTDVSQGEAVERLARAALDAFGAVHVVCNNAGVAPLGVVWEAAESDWRWALGVNLWGVIHGVRVFTPILLAQNGEGHIVNTASMAGVTSPPNMAAYNVSKHGVVTLSETLHQELAMLGASVTVSVLCPSFTRTRILDSARNRPPGLGETGQPPNEARVAGQAMLAAGQTPEEVAEAVLDAIRAERFWIFPYAGSRQRIQVRADDMLA